MQKDAELRQIAELLVAVAARAAEGGGDGEATVVIRDWLLELVEDDVDLTSVLADKLRHAFSI